MWPLAHALLGFCEGSDEHAFGDSGVNQNQTIHAGGGHECKEFRMFEAV